MSLSVETLAVARKYTDDSLAGAGAVAGVPCKIQSITAITGGNRVTFLWTDNNGDDHTSAMDVMNGVDGEDGKGIQSVTVNAQDHLIITYTDGTTVDAGQIEIHNAVDSVNGQTGAVVLDAEDVGALPDNTPIPSKTSDLTNDSGFATTSDVSTALADYTTTADLTTLLAAKQDTLTFDNVPTENSNNPVKSGGVYAVNEALTNQTNDMVNVLGAKNLLPNNAVTTTVNGITFTINNDGSITANGTATGDDYTAYIDFAINISIKNGTYIFSGLSDGSTATYSAYVLIDGHYYTITDSPLTFTVSQDTTITRARFTVRKGQTITNVTLYPMIRLASDPDSTYQPYAKTNQQLTQDTTGLLDNLEVNGAVNMLPNNATSQTINGITFTVNDDGTVTANGTATDNAELTLNTSGTSSAIKGLETGNYKLSGCPSGGGKNTYRLFAKGTNNTYYNDDGDGALISNTGIAYVRILIKSGQTVSNLTFKPMITVPSYNGDYVPYAKTNRELTENIGDLFDNGIDRIAMYDWGNTPPWMNSELSANTLDDIIVAMPTIERPSRLIIGTGVNNTNVLAVDLKTKGLHDSGATIGYLEITKITSYQNRAIVEYTYKDSTSLKKRVTSWINGTWTTTQTIL